MVERDLYHPPVMISEVLDFIKARDGGVFLDATLGGGGHSKAILEANSENRIIAIDRDEYAIGIAMKTLESFTSRVSVYHANFSQIQQVLKMEGLSSVNGVLFDLGMSHFHVRGERGFSFWKEQPLDMRMDRRQKLTAAEVVNRLSEKTLANIIYLYGEERFAKIIAREIVRARREKPIRTTIELANIIKKCIPKKYWGNKHPATKTFQAIRMYVNREIEEIKEGMPEAIKVLSPGGRIVVISFHSIEDRIVKHMFRSSQDLVVITKKPLTPSSDEIAINPSARSAKMRVAEKLP